MSLHNVLANGVLLQSIGVAGLLFARKKTAEPPAPPPAPADAALDPAFAERERIRRDHGVRLVNGQEEGSGVARAPDGVYGFTFAPLGEAPLFAKRDYHSFELHRLPGGAVQLIAFVTPGDAERIRMASEPFETRIYPDAVGDATTIIAIPADRLRAHKLVPSREPGNWIAVAVYPA